MKDCGKAVRIDGEKNLYQSFCYEHCYLYDGTPAKAPVIAENVGGSDTAAQAPPGITTPQGGGGGSSSAVVSTAHDNNPKYWLGMR